MDFLQTFRIASDLSMPVCSFSRSGSGRGSASSLSLLSTYFSYANVVRLCKRPSGPPALSHSASRWHLYSIYVNDPVACCRDKKQELNFLNRVLHREPEI